MHKCLSRSGRQRSRITATIVSNAPVKIKNLSIDIPKTGSGALKGNPPSKSGISFRIPVKSRNALQRLVKTEDILAIPALFLSAFISVAITNPYCTKSPRLHHVNMIIAKPRQWRRLTGSSRATRIRGPFFLDPAPITCCGTRASAACSYKSNRSHAAGPRG
jgi:hypothetical protein